jgi:hypothetical protein
MIFFKICPAPEIKDASLGAGRQRRVKAVKDKGCLALMGRQVFVSFGWAPPDVVNSKIGLQSC